MYRALLAELLVQSSVFRALFKALSLLSFAYRALLPELWLQRSVSRFCFSQNFGDRVLFTELCFQSLIFGAMLSESRFQSFIFKAAFLGKSFVFTAALSELQLQNYRYVFTAVLSGLHFWSFVSRLSCS